MVTIKHQSTSVVQPNVKDTTQTTNNNNNNNNNSSESLQNTDPALTSIAAFYDGAVIFLTGATGFLGKAVLEKLLRSCPGIDKVYILIRQKRGLSIEQRMKELVKNSVFDKIRDKTPEYFEKIKPVAGDVSQPNLGLSDFDKHVLISSVTVAFHSAATVRFTESLKDAVLLNTLGTKRVIKLCKEMRHIKSFIHVSTAYSNADKREIDEVVYKPPYDPETIIKCVESLPLDTINIIADKIQGKHPNTYTLTKAMAEYIIVESAADFPVAIVRPSIVTAAWKEPFPGWVDNVSGISGIMMEIGRGTIRSIICEDSYVIDVIPVDVVASTLISAAWHNATHKCNTVRVYNCTSGQVNGIKWKDFGDLTLKYAIQYPSKYTMWYPGFKFRTNRLMHWFCHIFLHLIPSGFLDVLLYCTRHKPIMLRICKKFSQAAKAGTFFAINEWRFSNACQNGLIDAVKSATDGSDFSVLDITHQSDFKWDPYVECYIRGIRKYVLKDDDSTLEAAKAKMKRLSWTKKFLQMASLCMFFKLLYHS